MTVFARRLAFSVSTACLTLVLATVPASAATHHKHHHKVVHHKHTTKKASKVGVSIKTAQTHLFNLGYYAGKIDGRMGSQTKTAIKHFQKDQGLKVDGVLGPKTMHALEMADKRGAHNNDLQTQDVMGFPLPPGPPSQDYAPSLNGGTTTLTSKYGTVEVSESGTAGNKTYNVTLNGQAILTADGQPSVIGMSPTYDLGNEDAIVFTTYSPSDANCTYKNHVLALSQAGTKLLDIENCTRAYQAHADNGSLYVTFPETDDNRAVGATWRVEGLSLERL